MQPDLALVSRWVEPGSRLLDLGCGDGALLAALSDEKQVTGYGLEIDEDAITRCVQRGVNVIEHDLDEGLAQFADNSFDVVIMAQTLQAIRRPAFMLDEMLRIGTQCIVTLPNFGHWRSRMHLLTHGRMPVLEHLPHEWYDTPNIHLCTIRDFEMLCHRRNVAMMAKV